MIDYEEPDEERIDQYDVIVGGTLLTHLRAAIQVNEFREYLDTTIN